MKRLLTTLLIALTCISCHTEARNMNTPRIDKLFEKTQPVCFGRFVMDVPINAVVVYGSQTFNGKIESFSAGKGSLSSVVSAKARELRAIRHDVLPGTLLREDRVNNSSLARVLVFFDDPSASRVVHVWGELRAEPIEFLYTGGTRVANDGVAREVDNVSYVATRLRSRVPLDVPVEPGVCLDGGFISDDSGKFQEIFGIGLRFPELPDASFSVSSNKDAEQGDSFEARRAEAKRAAFMVAPLATLFNKVKTLREGKLKVQQGQGSEALFRRPMDEGQGAWHEFQFEYAGKQYDHHNPSWDATLFTGVAHNRAGSTASSLTDDEAIALWDRLMSSVRLRVPNQ